MNDDMVSGTGSKLKACSKCGELFPLTAEFWHRNKSRSTGFENACKKCASSRVSKYYSKTENKEKARKYRLSNKQKIKNRDKLYYINNKDKFLKKDLCVEDLKNLKKERADYYKQNKKRISEKKKEYMSSKALYKTFYKKLSKVEPVRKSLEKEDIIEVKCAYCGNWFPPTVSQANNRVCSINGSTTGEGRFYCSDGCKHSCPIFRQVKYPKGFKKASSRELNPLLRQLVLKRDNYTCQKCGVKLGGNVKLHCHHVVPARQNPMTANDPDVCITLCKDCHVSVHSMDGCKYRELMCG